MASGTNSGLSQKLKYLTVSVIATLLSWSVVRYWLNTLAFPSAYVHLIDIAVVAATGIAATVTLVRLIAGSVATLADPT